MLAGALVRYGVPSRTFDAKLIHRVGWHNGACGDVSCRQYQSQCLSYFYAT